MKMLVKPLGSLLFISFVLHTHSIEILQRRDWLKNGDKLENEKPEQEADTVSINVQIVHKASSGYILESAKSAGPSYGTIVEGRKPDFYDSDESISKVIPSTKKVINPKNDHIEIDVSVKQSKPKKVFVSPNDVNSLLADPPPHDQLAKMARYVVKNSDWAAMATISTRNTIQGYPFANIFSVSDGPIGNSTGIPYLYVTPMEMSMKDIRKDNRASLTMSLAEGDYCRVNGYDPEDPRCAHVILTGNLIKVENQSENSFANTSLFTRHPEMESWPKDHGWFFAKLNITNVIVLDYFGGANTVTLEDYFGAN